MEKFILTLFKTLAYLYGAESAKHLIRGTVLLPPDDRKILIIINKKHDVATIFPDDLIGTTTTEELSPLVLLYFGADSHRFCGVGVTGVSAFMQDWGTSGGINSILPILKRFAGHY